MLRPFGFGFPYNSRPWKLEDPLEPLEYVLNAGMTVMCEASEVSEVYVWSGNIKIWSLSICVGYVSSQSIAASALRSSTGDDELHGPWLR